MNLFYANIAVTLFGVISWPFKRVYNFDIYFQFDINNTN
ncbi:hypothetical protein BbiDN127_A0023 (plasmid) [Borreliella bissettiae DN127]|uniref:Uncharacterized protein n=1 Tax=Borrelia bissettiae (strain DSM 17990 / CIP 109136 / DN127) TaxID=521010 RepID=G0APE8_BORBD|nr:hypothetical protein BbiDN127_A0023 [Borreliella bissettiae DN127]